MPHRLIRAFVGLLLLLGMSARAQSNKFSPAALGEEFHQTADPDCRRAILRGLAVLRDPGSAELIIAVLNEPAKNADLLADGIRAARQISSIYLTDALITLSKAPLPTNSLVQVIEALGHKGATDAIPAIAPHLRSSDWLVRETAIAALVKCGGHPTINAVLPMLSDAMPETRRAGVRVLSTFKHPRIVEPLLKAYTDPATRNEAIPGLANVPDLRALDAYLEGLGNPNVMVRSKCREAVIRLRDDALPRLQERASTLSPLIVRQLQFIYESNSQAHQGPLFGTKK